MRTTVIFEHMLRQYFNIFALPSYEIRVINAIETLLELDEIDLEKVQEMIDWIDDGVAIALRDSETGRLIITEGSINTNGLLSRVRGIEYQDDLYSILPDLFRGNYDVYDTIDDIYAKFKERIIRPKYASKYIKNAVCETKGDYGRGFYYEYEDKIYYAEANCEATFAAIYIFLEEATEEDIAERPLEPDEAHPWMQFFVTAIETIHGHELEAVTPLANEDILILLRDGDLLVYRPAQLPIELLPPEDF